MQYYNMGPFSRQVLKMCLSRTLLCECYARQYLRYRISTMQWKSLDEYYHLHSIADACSHMLSCSLSENNSHSFSKVETVNKRVQSHLCLFITSNLYHLCLSHNVLSVIFSAARYFHPYQTSLSRNNNPHT